VFFGYLSSPIKVLWVSALFVLIQWGENNILAPKIIGENLGMHPLIILLSIIVGGGIFGVFGMILSVPVVAVFRIVFRFAKDKMKKPAV
jgi:predicted PurR-regulated permease PerM